MASLPQTNFAHLEQHDEQLLRLGMLAEKYFADDPNTCLLKLRQLSELLAQLIAAKTGQLLAPEETQYELLRRLQDSGMVPREIFQLFSEMRRTGNAANHALEGDHRGALSALKMTWQLSLWFHRTFKDTSYKSGPFVPPSPPKDESDELRAEMALLNKALQEYQATHHETAEQLEATAAKLREAKGEQAFWEQMAAEAEQAKVALEKRLAALQIVSVAQPKSVLIQLVSSANTAASAVQLDEADTRKLIDQQLRQAGWEADSQVIKYNKGTRPTKGRNLAIAEWPTESGPADYALFAGLMPIGVVEAKRKNVDVSGSLQQTKRYSRTFTPSQETILSDENWGGEAAYRVPFAFSSNGRPFLRQIPTKSGIWFCDLRRADNLGNVLDGWYTPEGLTALLKRDEAKAHEDLANAPFNYGFPLRPYQQDAIRAAELAIESGQREMLLAMATGTGKTKTCIALIYRLLKAKRFRRILFLVDRSALGEQAANAFKDTRMENLQSFADTFGIKELEEQAPDTETAVHIATIQGMVQRLLYAAEDATTPSVDQYDCIVVDECHRGYLLDRELSDTEMTFRGYEDYISKYRRVLDYFRRLQGRTDCHAGAAHHANFRCAGLYLQLSGSCYRRVFWSITNHPCKSKPSYPPMALPGRQAKRSKSTMRGAIKSICSIPQTKSRLMLRTSTVRSSPNHLIRSCANIWPRRLDPASRRKTLIFCATDAHADMVVDLLKTAFKTQYGSVDDDAVIKITGAADKPLQLIRRYKNERNPNVAVTVDLLTTGIDVPEICNIVFLRRVNSRILFDQMLGRATRLCDEIEKEAFRVFDAVGIFEALGDMTAMRPVVVDPKISFTQLAQELITVGDETARQLVREQFLAKLQSKKRHLSEKSASDFETKAGMTADDFIKKLKAMPINDVAAWFTQNPDLGEILDRKGEGSAQPIFISEHEDKLHSAERGYGKAKKPEDYLKEFTAFIKSHSNDIPALMAVLTRPRELTRKQLRELVLELDKAGFTETNLATAWHEMTNQDIAARIVGYIRQAAIGDALVPYNERVDHALQKLLASRAWTGPQRDWLKKIAAQTKANLLVDHAALDDPDLIFKREGGGFTRLDKMFNGELQQVLETFNESIWAAA